MRKRSVVATIIAALACGSAAAAGISRTEYNAGKARIASEYEVDRKKCGPRLGNATDVCVAIARGHRKAATAELEAAHRPAPRTFYDAAIARADAEYGVAGQRCDYKKGDERKACVKDARAARDKAKAEAKAALQAGRSPR